MIRAIAMMAVALLLAACRQAQPTQDNAIPVDNVEDTTQPTDCAPPQVVPAKDEQAIDANIVEETNTRFLAAFGRACVNGLLESKEFIDPKAVDPAKLFLLNAPEANVASVYLSESAGNRMVLEYPFQRPNGQKSIPSPAELDEAIYCAVHGASAKEQEESGRCLPD